MIPNVLSIAGSDPSGGAGIQADIKAISANGAYAMAALTALTVQNTNGVRDVHLVPPEFVAAQIAAVLDDIEVHAIKIGMIATAEIAEAVAAILAARAPCPVVLDPVMVAKGGAALLDAGAVETVRKRLVPLAHVVTPNLPELARLADTAPIESREAMEQAAGALLSAGCRAIFAKGGHLLGADSPDLLLWSDGKKWFEGNRVATANTHGTGCTLSAAMAAQIAHGRALPEAASLAKTYVAESIAGAGHLRVGSGHGPIHHFHGWFG